MSDLKWADAWQQLVYEHAPSSAVDDRGFQDLLREARALEQLFLTTPALGSYCNEWRSHPDQPAEAPPAATTEPGVLQAPAAGAPLPMETIHVAAMQLQLMANAFYALRLDRYANAPDNRGWMNLFRTWGRSPTFRKHARELQATFSRQFVEFYYHYIENWPTDVPVPHPWDVATALRTQAVERYAGITAQAVHCCMAEAPTGKRGKGIFLDPGRVEAGPLQEVDEPLLPRSTESGH